MSAQYDLYETPDPDCTGEQKPLHARIVPKNPNTLLKKWNFLWSNANSFYRNF